MSRCAERIFTCQAIVRYCLVYIVFLNIKSPHQHVIYMNKQKVQTTIQSDAVTNAAVEWVVFKMMYYHSLILH